MEKYFQIEEVAAKTGLTKRTLRYYEDIELITEQIYENINLDRNSNWFSMLEKLENYIKINNKMPSSKSKYKDDVRLNQWLQDQQKNYKKDRYIFKIQNCKKIWMKFLNKYSDLFKNNEKSWYGNLNKLEQFIIENNKLPQKNLKNDIETKIFFWATNQKTNYIKKIKR